MVQCIDFVNNCVILTTTDCIPDSEEIRLLSNPYHPSSLLCLKNTIYVNFKSEETALNFINKFKTTKK